MVPVLGVVQSFSQRHTDTISSVLDVSENRPLCPVLIPLETNAIGIEWDYQRINITKGSEFVLECTIGKCQSQYKSDSATCEILCLVKCKYFSDSN